MSIDFDGTDSFILDDGGLTDLDFRPTRHFDGSDTVNTDDFTQDPSNPHLAPFNGADYFGFDDTANVLLRDDTFHGSDSFPISDSGTILFPRKFSGTDTFTLTDSGTRVYSIRTLSGADSFGFLETASLTSAGYEVSVNDHFSFREEYTVEKVLGPNNKTGSDHVIFTDSGTLTKGKGSKDIVSFFDGGCICLVSRRSSADSFSFGDRGVLWKSNHRVTIPGTLPGGHGATFRAIIRWNKVEGIKFIDNGYRVDASGIPIPDYDCCYPRPVGLHWPDLAGWAGLSSFGDILE